MCSPSGKVTSKTAEPQSMREPSTGESEGGSLRKKMKLNEFHACSPFSSHEGIPTKIVSISEVIELAAGSSAVNRNKHRFNVWVLTTI